MLSTWRPPPKVEERWVWVLDHSYLVHAPGISVPKDLHTLFQDVNGLFLCQIVLASTSFEFGSQNGLSQVRTESCSDGRCLVRGSLHINDSQEAKGRRKEDGKHGRKGVFWFNRDEDKMTKQVPLSWSFFSIVCYLSPLSTPPMTNVFQRGFIFVRRLYMTRHRYS